MDETQNKLVDRWITASRSMAALLEPEVCLEWHRELLSFHEAKLRGEFYEMTPLARAITAVTWEHITTNEELFFPPEAAAHYRRAPRAQLN